VVTHPLWVQGVTSFNPRLRQGFLCLIVVLFLLCLFLLFCPKHIIYHNTFQVILQCLFIKYS